MRVEGLEPPCLAASDPKSDTSTNFATPADHFQYEIRNRNTMKTVGAAAYSLLPMLNGIGFAKVGE